MASSEEIAAALREAVVALGLAASNSIEPENRAGYLKARLTVAAHLSRLREEERFRDAALAFGAAWTDVREPLGVRVEAADNLAAAYRALEEPREPTSAEIRARADELYARLGPAAHPDGGLNAVITMMSDRLSGPNLPVEGPAIQYWLNLLTAHKTSRAPLSPEIREALEVLVGAAFEDEREFIKRYGVRDDSTLATKRTVAAKEVRSFLSVSTEPEILSLTGDERGRLKEVRAALRIVLGTARNASGISPEEEQAIRVLEPLVAVSTEGLK